jgi:hypothetical protein
MGGDPARRARKRRQECSDMKQLLLISAFLAAPALTPALAQDQGDPNPPAIQENYRKTAGRFRGCPKSPGFLALRGCRKSSRTRRRRRQGAKPRDLRPAGLSSRRRSFRKTIPPRSETRLPRAPRGRAARRRAPLGLRARPARRRAGQDCRRKRFAARRMEARAAPRRRAQTHIPARRRRETRSVPRRQRGRRPYACAAIWVRRQSWSRAALRPI